MGKEGGGTDSLRKILMKMKSRGQEKLRKKLIKSKSSLDLYMVKCISLPTFCRQVYLQVIRNGSI